MAKYDLPLHFPLMNAAGSLGFVPPAHAAIDWDRLGAFVTNPISLGRRRPAANSRQIAYPGGFLLHTGYPNPGLAATLRRYRQAWLRAPVPVLVHLIPRNAHELAAMIPLLEYCENLLGLEVSLAPDMDVETAVELIQAAFSELPIILQLPLDRARELIQPIRPYLDDERITAISLGPARGELPLPEGGILRGRLYGPAVLPMALATVSALSRGGLPVIGAGGVYRKQDINAMLAAGAVAVQLDSVLWRGGID
jgi:dihydroorotate dehydrogenase (NAD+) catalytic subunit